MEASPSAWTYGPQNDRANNTAMMAHSQEGAVSLHKPDAEKDHGRGDTLDFHGPHDRVDIGADHEHVQNHVAGSEVTFLAT